MTSGNRRVDDDWPRHAAEFGPEDGTDPIAFHDRRGRYRAKTGRRGERTPGRKALQLCGQVRDALHGILSDCGDEVLHGLTVVSVEPAPNTGRLRVTVAVPRTADVTDRETASRHLLNAVGRLRAEVAASVNRKRAPDLTFVVM